MPIYYVICFQELIPCYLIKEGYIPCDQYRENPNDDFYVYERARYCIRGTDAKEGIFTDIKKAKEILKKEINERFYRDLETLFECKNDRLKALEKVK